MFLIRKNGKKARAHIWLGDDTSCRMWSTGGLKQDRFEVQLTKGDKQICSMCHINAKKEKMNEENPAIRHKNLVSWI